MALSFTLKSSWPGLSRPSIAPHRLRSHRIADFDTLARPADDITMDGRDKPGHDELCLRRETSDKANGR
jgi:hypothetical protein